MLSEFKVMMSPQVKLDLDYFSQLRTKFNLRTITGLLSSNEHNIVNVLYINSYKSSRALQMSIEC